MTRDTMMLQDTILKQDSYKLGEDVVKKTTEADNLIVGIGDRLKDAFANCQTSREFDMANRVFEAITGVRVDDVVW